jgi:hypothetical protein
MTTLVMAAPTIISPSSNTNHSSAISIEVTFANTTDVTDPINANTTLYYSIDDGTSWTSATYTFAGTNSTIFNLTLAITTIADNADVDFNVTLGNETDTIGMEAAGTVTNIAIDDTNPVATMSIKPSSISYGRVVDYKCTQSDATTGVQTKSAKVTHPSEDETSTTTLIPDGNWLQFSDTDKRGTFTFNCSATDYVGNTYSTTTDLTVGMLGRTPDRDGGTTSGAGLFALFGEGEVFGIPTIIIVLAGVGLAYYFYKKQ